MSLVCDESTDGIAPALPVADMTAASTSAPEKILYVLLLVVAATLLTSIGGLGIVAAPVTLALMILAVLRHASRAFRTAGALIGGLTAAQ